MTVHTMCRHQVAKVCDFGLARTRNASVLMTRVAGTFEYIAPEGFKANEPVTEKVATASATSWCLCSFMCATDSATALPHSWMCMPLA